MVWVYHAQLPRSKTLLLSPSLRRPRGARGFATTIVTRPIFSHPTRWAPSRAFCKWLSDKPVTFKLLGRLLSRMSGHTGDSANSGSGLHSHVSPPPHADAHSSPERESHVEEPAAVRRATRHISPVTPDTPAPANAQRPPAIGQKQCNCQACTARRLQGSVASLGVKMDQQSSEMSGIIVQFATLLSLLEGKIESLRSHCQRLDERLTTLDDKLDLILEKLKG